MRGMLTIARNTLFETMRQPVYGCVLGASAFLVVFSTQVSQFTFMQGKRMVQDMGLATILLTGLFLGVLSANATIHREIIGKSALTVLSKPVRREAFFLGKFLGIAGAVTLATYVLTLLLILTYRFGVKDAVYTKLDWEAAFAVGLALVVSLLVGLAHNYFFGRSFMTAAIWTFCIGLTIGVLALSVRDMFVRGGGFGAEIHWPIAVMGVLTLEAALILAATASAAATRTRAAFSLAICAVVFVGGLVSEFAFGRFAETSLAAKFAYTVFPNLQVFWVTDSLVEFREINKLLENPGIPASYVAMATAYALCYIGAALGAGLILFERREVRE